MENIVVSADVVDVQDRLPATCVAERYAAVPLPLCKQRQCLADIDPGIRVATLPLHDLSGILDVIEADVVSGKRHPGSIRFIHRICNALGLSCVILGATKNTVPRIDAIFDAEILCRVLGEHHDTAYACG